VNAGDLLARFEAGALIEEQSRLNDEMSKKQGELSQVQKQLEEATKANKGDKGGDKATLDGLKQQVAALRGVLDEQRSRFNHLNKQIEAANITAPISGTVTAIKHQPNEFVKQGQEVMTITQDGGAYILSYVRPGTGIVPKKDMRVLVRGQSGRKSAESRVQEVGTQVEPIPEHQLTNSKKPEWGIAVRIAMPREELLPLRPGELVVLNFRSDVDKEGVGRVQREGWSGRAVGSAPIAFLVWPSWVRFNSIEFGIEPRRSRRARRRGLRIGG